MSAKIVFNTILALFVLTMMLYQPITANSQLVVQAGLVSYWTFDKKDINGKTLKDAWGNNDGTIQGNPATVTGKIGDGMKFNGVDDQIVVKSSANLTIVDEITVCAWINWNGETGIIASKREPLGYQFAAIKDKTIQLCSPECIYSDPVLSANEWTYISVTRSKDNKVLFYKNGAPAGSKTTAQAWVKNDVDLIIAAWSGAGYKYAGILDELCIYNRALSANEIASNFVSKGLAVVNSEQKLSITWGEIKK
jgi:hypothetical protein